MNINNRSDDNGKKHNILVIVAAVGGILLGLMLIAFVCDTLKLNPSSDTVNENMLNEIDTEMKLNNIESKRVNEDTALIAETTVAEEDDEEFEFEFDPDDPSHYQDSGELERLMFKIAQKTTEETKIAER